MGDRNDPHGRRWQHRTSVDVDPEISQSLSGGRYGFVAPGCLCT